MLPVDPLTIGGAWLWEAFGGKFVTRLGEAAHQGWKKVDWRRAAERYRQEMQRLYGTMRITGMNEPVALADIFTDVYILDMPSAWRRYNIEELKARQSLEEGLRSDSEQRHDAVVVVQRHERLVILGKPGAGKTTLLKYLVLQATTGRLDAIPIFVGLKAWSESGKALMPFLVRQFAICAFPDAQPFIEDILVEGRAIVLFDGLDEINREGHTHERITCEVCDFSDQYPQSRCVITCRTAATDYQFERFSYCELADFTQEQVQTFVGNWFQRDAAKRAAFLEEFARPDHKGLRDLARTPLLLALLCIAFDETMHFPPRRVEIYEEALDALLKKWDASRSIWRDEGYRQLSLGRKRELLMRIAAESFEKGTLFMRQEDLTRQIAAYMRTLPTSDDAEDIDGEVVLRAIEAQHGLLIERAHRIYSFSHLTFQEYFTARSIAAHPAHETFQGILAHAHDPAWREVLLLTASMLDDTNAVVFFSAFHAALCERIKAASGLQAFFQWVQRKGAAVPPANQVELRMNYVLLVLNTMIVSIADERAPALFVAQARARALARALDTNLDLALTRGLARALVHHVSLARSVARTLVLAGVREASLDGNVQLDIGWASLLILIQLAAISEAVEERNATTEDLLAVWPEVLSAAPAELRTTLDALTLPSGSAPIEDWKQFERNVCAAFQTHLNIGYEWSLDESHFTELADYFNASIRMLECLDLAAVPDRAAIRGRILLPLE